MTELENCAYRIMRLLGVHHPKTVELATPDIVRELEQLVQAENATLKAYNRQLVGALEKISNIKIDIAILTSPWSGESETLAVKTEAANIAEQAFQTPSAKLPLAEAEVLRLAEEWNSKYFDPMDTSPIHADYHLAKAVESMQEARKDEI